MDEDTAGVFETGVEEDNRDTRRVCVEADNQAGCVNVVEASV